MQQDLHTRRFQGRVIACRVTAILSLLTIVALAGCARQTERSDRTAAGPGGQGGGQNSGRPPAVDVVLAKRGTLRNAPEYTGTTRPVQEVVVRSRVQGRVLALAVDVGDRVKRGQALGRLDPALLMTGVRQAEAELAGRQSEVASARASLGDAHAAVEQARLTLRQRQADAQRYASLAAQGAAPRQQAELTRLEARTAEQALRSAQAQVRNREQAVRAAQARVTAQRAAVAEQREQLSYAALVSPLDGVVLERLTETGNLLQPGDEALRLGDFSRVEVAVEVSELELSGIRPGQSAQVRLDALGGREVTGRVARVSPAADPVSRLVPIVVTVNNTDRRIGSGLLARVRFNQAQQAAIIVPESSLQRPAGAEGRGGRPGTGTTERPAAADPAARDPAGGAANRSAGPPSGEGGDTGTVFVVPDGEEPSRVTARSVRIGARADGRAEILSGLEPGERVVARSERPLKEGEAVRLSFLSETEGGKQEDDA